MSVFDLSNDSATLGLWLTQRLLELGESNKIAIDASLSADFQGATVVSAYFPASDIAPAWYYGSCGGAGLLLVGGAVNVSLAVALIEGYVGAGTLNGADPTNAWVEGVSNTIAFQIRALAFPGTPNLMAAGWSLGGCVAAAWAVRNRIVGPSLITKVITFGSPRFSGLGRTRVLSPLSPVRWMCSEDPIPLVPPRFSDVPALIVTVGAIVMRRWGNFVHFSGGLQLDVNSTITTQELPTVAAVTPASGLASWVLGIDLDGGNPHQLSRYRDRLSIWLSAHTPAQNAALRPAPAETTQTTRGTVMNIAETRVVAQIVSAGERQNETPLTLPSAQLFQAIHFGRIWVVTFAGQSVAIAPNKKGARATARAGNALLRRLQRSAYVDPGQVVAEMRAYLTMASTPGQGFSPLLQVTVPT